MDQFPVLEQELSLEIVNEPGLAQLCVLNGLFQRKSVGVEAEKSVAKRPSVRRRVQNRRLGEDENVDVFEPGQTTENLGERRGDMGKGKGNNDDQFSSEDE